MADLTNNKKYNYKRGVSVGSYELDYTEVAAGATVANIPPNSLITGVTVIAKTAGQATSTADVKLDTTVLANEVDLTATGAATTTVTDAPTGGELIIEAGAVAPTAGNFVFLVEYIEYELTTGFYTDV